jgi:hypothetical protein
LISFSVNSTRDYGAAGLGVLRWSIRALSPPWWQSVETDGY